MFAAIKPKYSTRLKAGIIQCSSFAGIIQCSSTYTAWSTPGNFSVEALAAHLVDCRGDRNVISSFLLATERPSSQFNMRYNYSCCKLPDAMCSSNQQVLSTAATTYPDNTLSLKMHNVSCGNTGVLTQFKLTWPSFSAIGYEYKCCDALAGRSLRCVYNETALDDQGSKGVDYLDRHSVNCLDGYFMNSFGLFLNATKMHYHYTCCNFDLI